MVADVVRPSPPYVVPRIVGRDRQQLAVTRGSSQDVPPTRHGFDEEQTRLLFAEPMRRASGTKCYLA
jgi:hypothetical protein